MRSRIIKSAILMFVCIGCFCTSTTFANSSGYSLNTDQHLLEGVAADKYYVNPGSVFVTSEGIFWSYEGHFIAINSVECDEIGVFLRPNASKWGLCPGCGYPLVWGLCVNPECPTKR